MNIALYPGAFKPPTKGHLGVVKQVLSGKYNTAEVDRETGKYTKVTDNPKMDQVWVIVGDMVKGGAKQKGSEPEVAVGQDEAMAVWSEYLKANGLEGQVKLYRAGQVREYTVNENVGYICEGENPIRDTYGLLKDKYVRGEHEGINFFPIVGYRPDNAEALTDLKRMDTASKKYGEQGLRILTVLDEPTPGEESVSATKLRAALAAKDKSKIEKYAAASADALLKHFSKQDELDQAIAEAMMKAVQDIIENKVDFNKLERKLDDMFEDLDLDINFTNHFKERVIERGLTEEDILELMEKIHDTYPDEVADLPKGENRVFTHIKDLTDIAAVSAGYASEDYLKDLILKTAYKRTSPKEPEFRTNASAPKLKVAESTKDMPSPEIEDISTPPSEFRSKVEYYKSYFQNLTSFPVAVDKYQNIVIQTGQRLPMNEVLDLNELTSQELNFTPFLSSVLEFMLDKKMRITPIPNIKIKMDPDAATDVFGPTAYYDQSSATVCLYILGRHPKDVLRSFCHEMIHHMQNMEGRLPVFGTTNTQEDSVLNEIEKEAHALGSMTFREWEDTVKNSFDIVKEEKTILEQEDSLTTEVINPDGEQFEYEGSKGLYTYKDSKGNLYFARLAYNPTSQPFFEFKVGWFESNDQSKPKYEPALPDNVTSRDNLKRRNTVAAIFVKEVLPFFKELDLSSILKIDPISKKRYSFSERMVDKLVPDEFTVKKDGDVITITKQQSLNEKRGKLNPFAKKLTTISFDLIKSAYENGSKVLDQYIYVGPDEDADIESDIEFDFRIFMERGPYNYTGGADNGDIPDEEGDYQDPYLMVSVTLPDDFTNWSELYMDLLDVIRHELEHLKQGGINVRQGGWMEDDSAVRGLIKVGLLPEKEYYKLEKEVDAMIQGLWAHAKKVKKPLLQVIDRYLSAQGVEGEDREEVLGAWRKRLPALGVPKDQRF